MDGKIASVTIKRWKHFRIPFWSRNDRCYCLVLAPSIGKTKKVNRIICWPPEKLGIIMTWLKEEVLVLSTGIHTPPLHTMDRPGRLQAVACKRSIASSDHGMVTCIVMIPRRAVVLSSVRTRVPRHERHNLSGNSCWIRFDTWPTIQVSKRDANNLRRSWHIPAPPFPIRNGQKRAPNINKSSIPFQSISTWTNGNTKGDEVCEKVAWDKCNGLP